MRSLVDAGQAAVLLLDCRAVIDIEYTALKMLIEAEEKLRARASPLAGGLNPEVLEVVRRTRWRRRWAGNACSSTCEPRCMRVRTA